MMMGKETLKIVKKLCKERDIELMYSNRTDICYANANLDESKIFLGCKGRVKEVILELALHEIIHVICYRKGIYKDYHCGYIINKDAFLKQIKQMVKAERYVERKAKEIFNMLFPHMKSKINGWYNTSSPKEIRKWFRELNKDVFRYYKIGE